MASWEYVRKTLHAIERPIDRLKFGYKRKFNRFDPLKIVPYYGYGSRSRINLRGRVLEDKEIGTASEDDPWWRNALSMIRRFTTDEVPGIRLRARYGDDELELKTDNEGYFAANWEPSTTPSPDQLWHEVQFELIDRWTDQDRVDAIGSILVPPVDADFGVISDVDDTILQSHATNTLQMAKLTFFKNAHTRTPFPKVSKFYRALQEGAAGRGPNPIFYVSSSAWNLYDLLVSFMETHGIPHGPLLLRELGIDSNKFIKSDHRHKLDKVQQILETYPDLRFILIGDSGQRDPWLYQEVVEQFPGRILVIYIRDVRITRRAQVEQIAESLRDEHDVDMLLMKDAEVAARDAAVKGLIHEVF